MTLRRLVIILLAVLAVSASHAQRRYSPEFYIGGHGGATLSQMSFNPSVPQSILPGVMMGITARYAEEKHFGIIAELNITQRGWKENFGDDPFSYSRTLTYLQLPLLTHIYFGNRKLRVFFNAGPEVAYMLGSKISSNFDYTDIKSVEGFPLRNRTNEQLNMDITGKFDYGISGGMGMEWFVNRNHSVQLEARFYFGIANIFSSKRTDVFNASRGWAIEVLAGYQFRLR